jgi:hypothetical protein
MLDALTGGIAPSVCQRESSMDDIEQTQQIPASRVELEAGVVVGRPRAPYGVTG